MDAFFASVEVLDDPNLQGLPVVVGGTGTRGVVASCSYEARAFGVRSAMPMVRARQLCPPAVVLAGRYSRYEEVSRRLREVLHEVTPLVEPIGLDEAFLDVTGAQRLLGEADEIAADIRRRVLAELGLGCTVGIGRSKLVAKLASRAAKPRAERSGTRPGPGIVRVEPEDELTFLYPMPVTALWGVGPATTARLHALGIETVAELAEVPPDVLLRHFGRAHGAHLADLARGVDPSPVVPDRAAKSLGHEETFRHDIYDLAELQRRAGPMAEAVAGHLRSNCLTARTVTVKVRFGDFSLITRSHSLTMALDTAPALHAVCTALLDAVDVTAGVRLLGVSVSGLQSSGAAQQLSFDLSNGDPASTAATGSPDRGAAPHSVPTAVAVGSGGADSASGTASQGASRATRLQAQWQEVTAALDDIRERFGSDAVGLAASIGAEGVHPAGRGRDYWGPSDEPTDENESVDRTV